MSVLAPWALAAAGVAAAVVVALHYLAQQHPRQEPLPTARFVPESDVRAPAPGRRPRDRLLLALRVAIVLLAGLAFAGAAAGGARRPVARVIAFDVSRAVGDVNESRDSVLALIGAGDVVVIFDSSARVVPGAAGDSVRMARRRDARGSLSAALAAARRASVQVKDRADSVELVLVSPAVREEWDAATVAVRSQWHGRIRVVHVEASAPPAQAGAAEIVAPASDPLRATLALLGPGGPGGPAATVRLERGALEQSDTAWALVPGRVLVRWPAAPPGDWRRPRPDTTGAVLAGDDVVVARFARATGPPTGTVVARWVDGAPAATERRVGAGCVREVAVPLPERGDLVLREAMRRFASAMLAPCGAAIDWRPSTHAALSALRSTGSLLATRALPRTDASRPPLTRWLLIGALALLIVEPLVRRAGART